MGDIDIAQGRDIVPPGGEENVIVPGDDSIEVAYIHLAKIGGGGSHENEYRWKGSLSELLGSTIREGCATMELVDLSVIYTFNDASDWISAAICSSFETNKKTFQLANRAGQLRRSANSMTKGMKSEHKFSVPGRFSTMIQPTSGQKPMVRLQVRASMDVTVFVRFRPLGGRVWDVTKN